MRQRIYVRDEHGTLRPDWSDMGPGHAALGHHRGELVVGISEQERNRADQKKHRAKQAAA